MNKQGKKYQPKGAWYIIEQLKGIKAKPNWDLIKKLK